MVIGGYNLRDMGDYRDRFKRILKLLEINSIYGNSLHSIFLKFPNSTKNSGSRSHVGRYMNTEQFEAIKRKLFSKVLPKFIN